MKQQSLVTVLTILEAIDRFPGVPTGQDSQLTLHPTMVSLFQSFVGICKDLI